MLCFFLPALTQRFTYSECIVRNISHILNTPLHAFRIHRFTHSEYNISRVPYTSFHVFRLHHFTHSEYNVSHIPNTLFTSFHSFPIFLYSKMYCVTIPPVLYRGPKITYNTPCSVQGAENILYCLLFYGGGQIQHTRPPDLYWRSNTSCTILF